MTQKELPGARTETLVVHAENGMVPPGRLRHRSLCRAASPSLPLIETNMMVWEPGPKLPAHEGWTASVYLSEECEIVENDGTYRSPDKQYVTWSRILEHAWREIIKTMEQHDPMARIGGQDWLEATRIGMKPKTAPARLIPWSTDREQRRPADVQPDGIVIPGWMLDPAAAKLVAPGLERTGLTGKEASRPLYLDEPRFGYFDWYAKLPRVDRLNVLVKHNGSNEEFVYEAERSGDRWSRNWILSGEREDWTQEVVDEITLRLAVTDNNLGSTNREYTWYEVELDHFVVMNEPFPVASKEPDNREGWIEVRTASRPPCDRIELMKRLTR